MHTHTHNWSASLVLTRTDIICVVWYALIWPQYMPWLPSGSVCTHQSTRSPGGSLTPVMSFSPGCCRARKHSFHLWAVKPTAKKKKKRHKLSFQIMWIKNDFIDWQRATFMETHVDEWVPESRNFSSISFYDKPLKRLKIIQCYVRSYRFLGVKEECD